MNKVTVTADQVAIEIEGWDKLWSFKGELKIPREAIARVYPRPKEMMPPWLKAPGTYLPKVIAAGTYRGAEGKEFWSTHFNDDCVVFDLKDFDFTRVVVDVPDAGALIAMIS
ncbi:MAG: hypothetical protein R6X35_08100 [Candidatus Krumholzibacteriia bacterium]